MNIKKYILKQFEPKDDYHSFIEMQKDTQKFLTSFITFLAVAIVISIYYFIKVKFYS